MKFIQHLRTIAEIVLLIAACLLIYNIVKIIPAFSARNYTGNTIGTAVIVNTVEDSGGHAGGTKHRVYVSYSVDGEAYSTVVMHGRFDNPEAGDTYRIRYDINNPQKCYVDSSPNFSVGQYATGMLISVILGAAGLMGIRFLQPKQEQE